MKHTLTRRAAVLAALPAALFLSSCATICLPVKNEVVLFGAPKDLTVTENGTAVPIERVTADTKSKGIYGYGQTITTYYTSGVKLDRRKPHTLQLSSEGKTATLNLKPKVSVGVVIIDLFTTGPLGIAIDAGTKKWKKLKPHDIDVQALLNGKEPRSKKKLKRELRQQLNGK